MKLSFSCDWIERNSGYLKCISDKIWELAETALNEHSSSLLLEEALQENGFKVEKGIAGMQTAFKAEWGKGKPVIGFLAEYDALPGLSQKALPRKEAVIEGGAGHGCGHNLLGTGILGAALGLKNEMQADDLQGTIVVFGCPAEEILTGKVFMARDGLFDNLDAAFTWHPGFVNAVSEQSMLAMNSVKFNFYGKAAYAALSPEQGRSALDAVELMDTGVNYLREHIPSDVRIHYTITNGGGEPNVVPPYAQVWYYIRSPKREEVDVVYERVVKIAQGAALMTETQMKIDFLTGCYELLTNDILNKVMYDSFVEVEPPVWDEKELEFAQSLTETFSAGQKAMILRSLNIPWLQDQFLHQFVFPLTGRHDTLPGSTDVSDVSWITPTTGVVTCCQAVGTSGHSWQVTAASGTSIGHKGMLYAAKALALAGSKLVRTGR